MARQRSTPVPPDLIPFADQNALAIVLIVAAGFGGFFIRGAFGFGSNLPFVLTGAITALTALDFLGFGLPVDSPSKRTSWTCTIGATGFWYGPSAGTTTAPAEDASQIEPSPRGAALGR